MTYWVTSRYGDTFEEPDASVMDAVLAELDGPPDIEHPDVALSHESEWTLSVFENGLVVWENVAEDDEPRHRHGLSRAEIRRLWQELAAGNLERVNAEEWYPATAETPVPGPSATCVTGPETTVRRVSR